MIRPIGTWIHVIKCFNDHVRNANGDIIIYRTDKNLDTTNFARIVSCGKDCVIFADHVGETILCPEQDADMKSIGDDQFFIRERYFKKTGVCAVFGKD